MNYELAKKLKDAGFPIELIDMGIGILDIRYYPTLSELIEECGGKNFKLQADSKGVWYAASYIHGIGTEGTTPEEAVANLWLELHKNNSN